jgi:hypothetical protein
MACGTERDYLQSLNPSGSGVVDGVLPNWTWHHMIGTSNRPDAALPAAVPRKKRVPTAPAAAHAATAVMLLRNSCF